MSKITYIQSDGKTLEIDASDGMILMQLPTMEGVENIEGSYGGAMSCATCHVHVEAIGSANLRHRATTNSTCTTSSTTFGGTASSTARSA